MAQPIDNETPVDRATFVLGDRRTTVEYDVPIRDVGERYVGPDGLSVGVEFYLLPETVERELTDADGTRTYEADGGQLLMIECAVTNEDQVDRTPPSPKAFELLDEHGNSHDLSIVYPAESSVADAEFVRPITAAAYDDGELAPGETESGWILFRTETSVAIDRSRLRWERLDRRRDSDEPVGLTVEWRFSSTTE
ncbi:DUF4352 domain-containing protein [Natronobacterium haloterrestre]|uniref:DUF4352 domain-containing protein n=1 Tax=Natronobacterium haloterrestre TaxID=148448 RepID=UPI00116030E1|nr:DUF4352 domain-containing protein [Halobiforma haloterrestris]